MPKLTRHTSFSDLKADVAFSASVVAINERAHAELEAFMNRLKVELAKKKAKQGHGKQFRRPHS